jgi:hypothetical protein
MCLGREFHTCLAFCWNASEIERTQQWNISLSHGVICWNGLNGRGRGSARCDCIDRCCHLSFTTARWMTHCRLSIHRAPQLRVTKRSVSAGYQQEISNVTCRHFSSNQCCSKVAMSSVSLVTVARCGEWRLRCFQFPWHGITCARPSESYIASYAVILTRCHITLSLSLLWAAGHSPVSVAEPRHSGRFRYATTVSSLCLLSERGLDL